MAHVGKHATHVALVASALLVLWLANIELSAVALVVLLAACLVLFEGGLWFIHRRDEKRRVTVNS
jgi:hypothetical protein